MRLSEQRTGPSTRCRRRDYEGTSFAVDLQNETVTFDGGFSVPIVEMIDRRGEYADDPEDAEVIVVGIENLMKRP
jgi:hypothetical protein